ncbi:MAG: 50S ribosomal protein L9 [Planctomycetaceae bacterium]
MPRKTRIKAIAPESRRRITELLLAESVPNLGEQGQIVRVRAGYARNFLIPQGYATIATEYNKKLVERHRERQADARKEQLKSLKTLADNINKYSVTIEANANSEGQLYGSILAADISGQLQNAGFAVNSGNIKLEGPLKETGMYSVRLDLGNEIDTEVKVWVVPKAADAK